MTLKHVIIKFRIVSIKIAVVLLPLALITIKVEGQAIIDMPVVEFAKAIARPGIQVLDVRTDAEFRSGHIQNSLWADWTNAAQFAERTASLDKSKPVYTYCLSGGRSGSAAKYLREKGYQVYNMKGGMLEWKKATLPVEQAAIVKQIDRIAYEAMIPKDKLVLVDFGADWCPPCKKMQPVLDALSSNKDLHFKLMKVDAGDQTQLVQQMHIEALPTFIIYKDGKEVWRKAGLVESSEFVSLLK